MSHDCFLARADNRGNQRNVLKTRDLLIESWKDEEKIRDTRYKAQGTVVGYTRNESAGRKSRYVPNLKMKRVRGARAKYECRSLRKAI